MRKARVKLDSLIGEKLHYITLLNYFKKENGHTYWNYVCDCGTKKVTSHSNVSSGNIKSCGCKKSQITREKIAIYYKRNFKDPVEARLFSSYRMDCKSSNREFLLDFDYFKSLVNSNCSYCGEPPYLIRGNKTKSVVKPLNGVDRVDSSKGYTIENTVSCCPICNRAKMDSNISDFKSWINKIYQYQNKI